MKTVAIILNFALAGFAIVGMIGNGQGDTFSVLLVGFALFNAYAIDKK